MGQNVFNHGTALIASGSEYGEDFGHDEDD
jgi:hypothetical protein